MDATCRECVRVETKIKLTTQEYQNLQVILNLIVFQFSSICFSNHRKF